MLKYLCTVYTVHYTVYIIQHRQLRLRGDIRIFTKLCAAKNLLFNSSTVRYWDLTNETRQFIEIFTKNLVLKNWFSEASFLILIRMSP